MATKSGSHKLLGWEPVTIQSSALCTSFMQAVSERMDWSSLVFDPFGGRQDALADIDSEKIIAL